MIAFDHPEALLLIPLWLAVAWCWPRQGWFRPLRLLIGVLVMLAWLNPRIPMQSQGLDLWVLVDRSLSAEDHLGPRLPEVEALLARSKGRDDRLRYVDFAEDMILRDPLEEAVLSGRRDATRVASAVRHTLGRLDPRRVSRLLVLTDGYSTEPLDELAETLIASRVPMDVRFFAPAERTDFRVRDVEAPLQVLPGEPFVIEARIEGTDDGDVPAFLYRDGERIGAQTVPVRRGRALARWTDVLSRGGAVEYTVRIDPAQDAWPGNNRQVRWIEARGQPRVLLVSAFPDDPVATMLRAQGMDTEVVTRTDRLRGGHLTGVAAVILNNVPAYALPGDFIQALPFYVTEQGGGLIMMGGNTSFAAGGYFESPVDPLLPVSMELKQEHRQLAVAMAIVMDRSGSMRAHVPGAGGLTKMDLANEGAARAIELLGARDAVAVYAVDTQAHEILPLTTLGENRRALTGLVRRIQSQGGGIFVTVGLQAGWNQLQRAEQGQRHLILFSDAADTEQPGGHQALVDEMVAAGATLSVIALGTEQDKDADLLKAIAARGQGRILFNADAATLPALFAQETVALSRSAFLTDPVGLSPQPGWLEMAGQELAWPGQVDAYNLSYLRPDAAAGLIATDEYEAPLVAQWTRGAGRVVAVSFPVAGEHASSVLAWPAYGDFIRTLARWSMREDTPPGMALRMDRSGSTIRVEWHHDESWLDGVARQPPELVTTRPEGPGTLRHRWRRMRPGMFETAFELPGDTVVHGALRVGGHVLPFGPVSGTVGAEWQFDPDQPRLLRQVCELSGGEHRVDLTGIWSAPRLRTLRGLRDLCLIAALLLILLEALYDRIGGSVKALRLDRQPARRRTAPPPARTPPTAATPAPEKPVESSAPRSRKNLFDRARHHGKL